MKRSFILIIVMGALLSGCESNTLGTIADDSGTDADIAEARMALDDGNYDKAISLVEDDYNTASPDMEIASILASAYMGKAGLDLTYALENIGDSERGNFDTIASALSLVVIDQGYPASAQLAGSKAVPDASGAWYITQSSIDELLGYLEQAQDVLMVLIHNAEDRGLVPDDDATVQLGLASALHFIMEVGFVVSDVLDSNVPINQKAYQEVFPEDTDWTALLDETTVYLETHPEDLTALKTDLLSMYGAVQTLTENIGRDEDITEELDGFICDLLGLPEGSSDQAVTNAINSYTAQDIAEFVRDTLLMYE
ncbi:MAG TPA: hypothetical protein PLR71_11500 [Deltaproteobacteria bacterium]|nr:hypothetical protein [Deltaproteobacteria bacterium]HQI82168.1 hypothetical protein [Deltaproteobacteria bacterium]